MLLLLLFIFKLTVLMNCLLIVLKYTSYFYFPPTQLWSNLRSHLCNTRLLRSATPAISHWERQMDGMAFFNVISQLFPAVWFTEEQNFFGLTKTGRAVFACMSQGNKRYVLLHNLSTAAAFELVWHQRIAMLGLEYRLLTTAMPNGSMCVNLDL